MEKNRRIAELELQSKEKVQQVEASSAAQLRVVREKHEVAAAGLEAENRTLKGEVAAMKNTHAREGALPTPCRARAGPACFGAVFGVGF